MDDEKSKIIREQAQRISELEYDVSAWRRLVDDRRCLIYPGPPTPPPCRKVKDGGGGIGIVFLLLFIVILIGSFW